LVLSRFGDGADPAKIGRPVESRFVIYSPDVCARDVWWHFGRIADSNCSNLPSEVTCFGKKIESGPASSLPSSSFRERQWLGNHAWVVCLWALRDYRDLAFRPTSPALLLMSREAFIAVSRNRLALSIMLRLRNGREIEQQLRKVAAPRCQTEPK
jgi:hypothetical protein